MLAASAQLDARIAFDPAPPPPLAAAPAELASAAVPPRSAATVVPPLAATAVESGAVQRVSFAGVWGRLAHCESSGNPRAVSRDRRYHGLFQFSMETWRFLGYTGNPADATPAKQLAAAKRLKDMRGWNQWPRCARTLSLL